MLEPEVEPRFFCTPSGLAARVGQMDVLLMDRNLSFEGRKWALEAHHRAIFALLYQNPSSSVANTAVVVCTHALFLRVLARDPSPYAKFLRNVQVLVVDEANELGLTDFCACVTGSAECLALADAGQRMRDVEFNWSQDDDVPMTQNAQDLLLAAPLCR